MLDLTNAASFGLDDDGTEGDGGEVYLEFLTPAGMTSIAVTRSALKTMGDEIARYLDGDDNGDPAEDWKKL